MPPQPETSRSEGRHTRLTWALAVTQLVSWGANYYSFSVFVVPMERDLGWSRVELTNAFSLGLLVGGLAAPFVGARIDREGGRRIMTAGSLLASLMLALWAWSPSLPAFYGIWLGLGLSHAMTLYEPAFAVLNRELSVGAPTAIARVAIVAALASTLFIPLTQLLVEAGGWRFAALVLAALNLGVVVPFHALAVPGRWRIARAPGTSVLIAPVIRRVSRNVAFWGLFLAYALGAALTTSMTVHILPLLLERGFATGSAVGIVALIGPMQLLGRVVLYAFGRRLTARAAGRMVMLILPAAVTVLLWEAGGAASAVVFAVLYGFAVGTQTIMKGTATAELMGRQDYGLISGLLAPPTAVARALAPAVAGAVWAATGGYGAVLWMLVVFGLVAAAAFWIASFAARPASDSGSGQR